MVSLPSLLLVCLLTHTLAVREASGWRTGKARNFGSQAELGCPTQVANGMDLPS